MQFGLELANTESWDTLRSAALLADRQRWRTLWTYDHLLPPTPEELPLVGGSYEAPVLEGWTLLAGLATLTRRVRLGCMVSAVGFRHPGLLAKMAATVEAMAAGRLELGIGAGWHEREHEAFGLELGDPRTRLDRLEEACEILRRLLPGGPVTHQGRFYRLREAVCRPAAPVPLLIAGGGERRTLRLVARLGDACNVYGNLFGSYEEARRKLQVLDRHCADLGRDPREIRRTVTLYADLVDDPAEAHRRRRFLGQHLPDEEADALPIGEPTRLIEAAAPYAGLGVDEIVLNVPSPGAELLERLDREVLACFEPAV